MIRAFGKFLRRIGLLAIVAVAVVGYLAAGLDERVSGIDRDVRGGRPGDDNFGLEEIPVAGSVGVSEITVDVAPLSGAEVPLIPTDAVSVDRGIRYFDEAMAETWDRLGAQVAPAAIG